MGGRERWKQLDSERRCGTCGGYQECISEEGEGEGKRGRELARILEIRG